MSLEQLIAALPPPHQKHLAIDGPMPMKMMAAKGMAPLPPREMVIVLCGLTYEADEKLSASARESLAKLPDKIVGPVLSAELPAAALAILAEAFVGRDAILEALVLNKATPDAALAAIAPIVSDSVAEILATNQERLLRSMPLVLGLRDNPRLLRSSKDRIFDFLVRAGVIDESIPEFSEAFARLSPAEIKDMSAKIELPPEVAALTEGGKAAAAVVGHEPEEEEEELDLEELGAETVKEGDSEVAILGEDEKKRIPMMKLINELNTAQKIALATRGNKEARSILIRETNKMVAVATIRSPRITEQEIVSAAQSRSISDDVIRIICKSRDMTRPYSVKMALAGNPKTPMQTAMKFLPLLRQSDLKSLAKSKNVSSAVSAQAKRILLRKSGGGKADG